MSFGKRIRKKGIESILGKEIKDGKPHFPSHFSEQQCIPATSNLVSCFG